MKTYLQLLIEFIEDSKPMSDDETRIWYKAMMLRKAEEQEEKIAEIFKYKLVVKEGEYYGDSLLTLYWQVIKHRLWHLRKHGKWITRSSFYQKILFPDFHINCPKDRCVYYL